MSAASALVPVPQTVHVQVGGEPEQGIIVECKDSCSCADACINRVRSSCAFFTLMVLLTLAREQR